MTRGMKRINSFWPSIAFGIALLVGMGRMLAQQEQIIKQLVIFEQWKNDETGRRQQFEIDFAMMKERLRVLEGSKKP